MTRATKMASKVGRVDDQFSSDFSMSAILFTLSITENGTASIKWEEGTPANLILKLLAVCLAIGTSHFCCKSEKGPKTKLRLSRNAFVERIFVDLT